MAEPALRLIDTTTGEVTEPSTESLEARVLQLEGDLANRERTERKLLREIAKLLTDKDRERSLYALRSTVELVFDEWRAVCGHPKAKLGPVRFDAIRARVEQGYDREHFAMALHGARLSAFTREQHGRTERFDDVELICRDESHFERFANRAPKGVRPMSAQELSEALPAKPKRSRR